MEPEQQTLEDIYYRKLISAMTCAKLERWSECLAHGLSALDAYQQGFSHLHDVLCYIARSAGKMFVSVYWCCLVLKEARLQATSVEQLWTRTIILQGILLDHGMFALELEVFQNGRQIIVDTTHYYQSLLLQHLQGRLAQAENCLAVQYVHQTFHKYCESECERIPNFEYSYEKAQQHLSCVYKLAVNLTGNGWMEYFKAYCYLYSTMMQVQGPETNLKTHNNMLLATIYLELSIMAMKSTEPHFQDAKMMHHFIKRKAMTVDVITASFTARKMVKYTHGARNFLFRAMLVTMYWENKFQPLPLLLLANAAKEMDAKVSSGSSYRTLLLNVCVKVQDVNFKHVGGGRTNIADYPIFRQKDDSEARLHWTDEKTHPHFKAMGCLMTPFLPHQILPSPASAEYFLMKNKRAEQAYAFGHQITEAWTAVFKNKCPVHNV